MNEPFINYPPLQSIINLLGTPPTSVNVNQIANTCFVYSIRATAALLHLFANECNLIPPPPPVPPIFDPNIPFTQNPDPICKGTTGTVYAHLSQGDPNSCTWTWEALNKPAGVNVTPQGSSCAVYYPNSAALTKLMAPIFQLKCTASIAGIGSDTKYYTPRGNADCTGCPTLGFIVDNMLVDENPLLISSLSNPGTDVTDYYLVNTPITPENGSIKLTIHEPQTEHTWLDQTQLIEARVNRNEYTAVTDDGEIVNYRKPLLPFTITLNDTLDVTGMLSELDSVKYEFKAGDLLKIELNNMSMGSGGDNDLILGAESPIFAKKIAGNLRFVSNSNSKETDSQENGIYRGLGDFFIRPNMSIICKRLGRLQNGSLEILLNHDITIDYLTVIKNLKTARTKTLNMLTAVHGTNGDVKDKLLNIDQNYAEIYPGDFIDYTFAPTQGDQDKKAYILKSVGRYETDTAYVMMKGNNLTSTGDESIIPKENKLYDNYPNPFNPSTQIKYSVKEQGLVNLKVYDSLGEVVAELVNQTQPAGTYTVNFNARNLASGIYFYSIEAKDYYKVKKMILLK